MRYEQLMFIHSLLASEDDDGEKTEWISSANLILANSGIPSAIYDKEAADVIIRKFFQDLLEDEDYIAAATILWGQEMFDTRPTFVKDIFRVIRDNAMVLFQGASSVSKTYSAGAWTYLDWRRDPKYTAIKVAALSEDHLRKNIFSHIHDLHQSASIPYEDPEDIKDIDLYFGLRSAGNAFGFSGVAFKQSSEASGHFKGYKSKPVKRKTPHPKFGYMSRIRILGDEGENWPAGPFGDFASQMASISGTEFYKIIITYNPESTSQKVVQLAEPEQGWQMEDMESLYEWVSKEGWHVLRLDAKMCENVIQRKDIYRGFQTYEGFLKLLKGEGDTSSRYATFARGWPPLRSQNWTVVPASWPSTQRGEAIFDEIICHCASVDCAYQGMDKVIMTVGKYGIASGWVKANGETVKFLDPTNPKFHKSRPVLQYEQQFSLLKSASPSKLAEEIKGKCMNIGIEPSNLVIDGPQPLSEPVLTKSGWRTIGSIIPGDTVIGSSGSSIGVLSIHPQGVKPIYKISFSDGSWTRCSMEHLWNINLINGTEKTVTTKWISDYLKRYGNSKISIPRLSSPVEFVESTVKHPVNPYLLGCLLGEGNIRTSAVRFSNMDKELLGYVSNSLPAGVSLKHDGHGSYGIRVERPLPRDLKTGRILRGGNPLVNGLRELGLDGKLAREKYIPQEYMTSSIIDRIEILRGLLDTDGYVNAGSSGKSCSFGMRSTSKRLIEQVIEICETLGGWGSMHLDCQKKRKNENPTWNCSLYVHPSIIPFKISRKINRLSDRIQQTRRIIKDVSYDGEEECTCITTDSCNGLYATRHGILTHNSGQGAGTASWLKEYWGDIMSIDWGRAATEMKILTEDTGLARDRFPDIISEMWFAFKEWLNPDVCAVLIHPMLQQNPINVQLTTRRFSFCKGNKQKVESKESYKARNQRSPDEVDSMIMLPHLLRTRANVMPGLSRQADNRKPVDQDRETFQAKDPKPDDALQLFDDDSFEGKDLQ